MDFRLKIVVALVVGFFLEMLSYQVFLGQWVSLDLHTPFVKILADLGLGPVARHFGLIWTRVPEWLLAFIAGVVIALKVDKNRRAAAMFCALGLMIGGYVAPFLEGYGETYGKWGMKFTLAYLVLGLGTLLFAYIGSGLGNWAGRRAD
ncbi:MAG: hypothetical protein ACYTFO_06735 [Planctomycetota bacterium]|jgi:hypothetical protein